MGRAQFGGRVDTEAVAGLQEQRRCERQAETPAALPERVALDRYKQGVYASSAIQAFADSETERFHIAGRSRRMPTEIRKRAAMRLLQLNAATRIEDMRLPPSKRLEQLQGDRAGQWSMRINDQWRVCFRFKNGDAFDVEIVDYR